MVKTQKNRNIISFEVSDEIASMLEAVKANPKARRGFQTDVLRRLLENFLADFGNWEDLICLDDDLRSKFERYQFQHNERKGRMLKIETQNRIYWDAMKVAFDNSTIPILWVRHGIKLFDEYVGMIRAKTFEESNGELSIPNDMIKKFINDAIDCMEASGDMNQIRCKVQAEEYENEYPKAKS